MRVSGFTLVELLVIIGIIAVLVTLSAPVLLGARVKARDAKRKAELTQIGRFLTQSCYLPNGGPGIYDLVPLGAELRLKYPQYAAYVRSVPQDPKTGSETESRYYYQATEDGSACVLYANLENGEEPVTISGLTQPTPGRGTGVLEAALAGWNGSRKYFQVSR